MRLAANERSGPRGANIRQGIPTGQRQFADLTTADQAPGPPDVRLGRRRLLWPATLLAVISLALMTVGAAAYLSGQSAARRAAEDNVAAVARLKARAVASWAEERRGDAAALAFQISESREAMSWLAEGAPDDALAAVVRRKLHSLDVYRNYRDVTLVDPAGRVLVSTASAPSAVATPPARTVAAAAAGGSAALAVRQGAESLPDNDDVFVLAPVPTAGPAGPGGRRGAAVVVLRINRRLGLDPLIAAGPGGGSGAATMAVDRVSPGPPPSAAQGQRFADLARAAAAHGFQGVFEVPDAAGGVWIAASAPVADTPWAMVARVDADEIYAPLRRTAGVLALAFAILLLSGAVLLIASWRREQAKMIARQAEAEDRRKALARRFEFLSRFANDIILLVDGAGRIAEATDRAIEAYGWPRERLVGADLTLVEPPGVTPSPSDRPRGAGGQVFETIYQRRDGTRFPAEVSQRRVSVDDEISHQLIIRDITERRRAEQAAAVATAVLTAEQELSPDGILVVSQDGRWLSFNRRFAEIWALPPEVVAGRDEAAALRIASSRVADPSAFLEKIEHLQRHSDERSFERLQLIDGRTIERHSAPLALDIGDVRGRVWFFRDITERLQSMADQSLLAAVVRSSTDAVCSVDLAGVVTTWNPAAERMLGFSAEEVIGRPLRLASADGAWGQGVDGALEAIRGRQEAVSYEVTRRRKDESLIDLSVVVSAIRAPDGAVIGGSLIARDITERRRAERLIRRSNRALAALSEANAALARARTRDGLYQRMCEIVVETGGFRMAWVGVAQKDAARTVRPIAFAGHEAGYLDSIRVSWADDDLGRGPTGTAIRSGESQVNNWSDEDIRFAPWRAAAQARGYHASLALPLREGETMFGALTIYSSEAEAFGPDEVALLEELARDLTVGITTLADRQARDRLAAIVESSEDAIIAVDLEGVVTSWNQGAVTTYGYEASEAIGGGGGRLIVPAERREESDALLERVRRGERPERIVTERVRKDGRRITVALTASPTYDLSGKVDGLAAIARDITEQQRVQAALQRSARFDQLTDLPNRATFTERVRAALRAALPGQGAVVVALFDLDHFKDVNDTLGHAAGDRLLREVSARLAQAAGPEVTVARFGGDEFALVLEGVRERSAVDLLIGAILSRLGEPLDLDGALLRTAASVGLALGGAEVTEAETLISQADIALYRAKEEGRGVLRYFNGAMDEEVRRRVLVGRELRAAIEGDELTLFYQPQVSSATGALIGMEALARWLHPTRGPVSPAEFVPIAEKIGLAAVLGRWVINRACAQVRAWLDAGLSPPVLAVNLSGAQFATPGELERDLDAILARHRIAPAMLELELTETVLMDASLDHRQTLMRLRARGFGLSIDDFGTGYSSLDYLRRFPADRIKIDQNFIRDIHSTPGNEAIVKAMISLARQLNMAVIAEGVETAAHRDLLRAWDCREMQGYYFARPLPAEEITALLRSGQSLPLVA